jgi:hypothetical protein
MQNYWEAWVLKITFISFVFALVMCHHTPAWTQSLEPATASSSASVRGSAIKKLLSAKKAYLLAGAPNRERRKTPGLIPENLASTSLAHEELTKAMQKWGRFEIVNEAAQADIVLVLLEWNEVTKWGKNLQCHNRLMAFEGGVVPTDQAIPIWQIEGGQWGGCSAAKRTVKDFRSELEKAEKAGG